jgi:hypothetical protein
MFHWAEDLHLKLHWKVKSLSILIGLWRMRRPLIRKKYFHKLPLDKENKFKEGSWEAFGFWKSFILCLKKGRRFKKRRRMNV